MTPAIEDVYVKLARLAGLAKMDDREASEVVRDRIDKAVLDGQHSGGRYLKEFWRLVFDPDSVSLTIAQEQLVDGLFDCLAHGWVSKAGPGMYHGVWDHFKGGLYLTTGVGKHAETGALEVEYLSLLHGTKHHRRCEQWNEVVQWPDRRYRSRFIFRGTDLTAPAPTFKVVHPDQARLSQSLFGVGEPESTKVEDGES